MLKQTHFINFKKPTDIITYHRNFKSSKIQKHIGKLMHTQKSKCMLKQNPFDQIW